MDQATIDAVQLGGTAMAHDMSLMGLFFQADIVVKAVMIMLVIASIWCWAIIFDKIFTLRGLNSKAKRFEETFWSGGSLEALYDRVSAQPSDAMARSFAVGMKEWRRAQDKGGQRSDSVRANLSQRIERIMGVEIEREVARAERGMTFLASVGSTAPFIGLFGTVWGIMNAFAAIANANSTSLAVVAPGIAEALFATALGLVAAIPAVVAYNKFSNDIGRYADRLENFAAEFNTILSRHLDDRG